MIPKVTQESGLGKSAMPIRNVKIKNGWKNMLSRSLKNFLYFFLSALLFILELINQFVHINAIIIIISGVVVIAIFISILKVKDVLKKNNVL